MSTLKAPAAWNLTTEHTAPYKLNLRTKFNTFADGQLSNRTLWYFINLIVHGVFILPLPAVLLYYFDAPIAVLAITMTCFFTNIIANMGGAGIRATTAFFFGSLIIHIIMVLLVVL